MNKVKNELTNEKTDKLKNESAIEKTGKIKKIKNNNLNCKPINKYLIYKIQKYK